MHPNRTLFGNALFTKPGIYEADMHDVAVRDLPELLCFQSLVVSCGELVSHLAQHWSDEDLDVNPEESSNIVSIKLQWNNGKGGCFPAHYDNPGAPSKRALTCILYLNDNWEPHHGGELTLIPFLGEATKLAPLFNRLVIFRSNTMLHRVETCLHSRFCVTVWIDGTDTNSAAKSQLKLSTTIYDSAEIFAATIGMLQSTPLQRSVSRAVYKEEYESSLLECMHDAASAQGLSLMLAAHRHHIKSVKENTALLKFVNALRERIGRGALTEGE